MSGYLMPETVTDWMLVMAFWAIVAITVGAALGWLVSRPPLRCALCGSRQGVRRLDLKCRECGAVKRLPLCSWCHKMACLSRGEGG